MMDSLLDPSPVLQTAVYMGGMLLGYLFLTTPAEWARARAAVRDAVREVVRGPRGER
ncbi:MAG TPA: hypothetical protein VFS40_13850 [Gemmatimonadales bacterium]|nr:hypothetical protein [Gemmatimonadales bacterium]